MSNLWPSFLINEDILGKHTRSWAPLCRHRISHLSSKKDAFIRFSQPWPRKYSMWTPSAILLGRGGHFSDLLSRVQSWFCCSSRGSNLPQTVDNARNPFESMRSSIATQITNYWELLAEGIGFNLTNIFVQKFWAPVHVTAQELSKLSMGFQGQVYDNCCTEPFALSSLHATWN